MMSMRELFYGDNETTSVIMSNSWPDPVNPYLHSGEADPYTAWSRDASKFPAPEVPHAVQTRRTVPTVDLKVHLCCAKCEEKVTEALFDMDGVEGVKCDQLNQRVTVTGNVAPEKLLRRVKRVKRSSDLISTQKVQGRHSQSSQSSHSQSSNNQPYSYNNIHPSHSQQTYNNPYSQPSHRQPSYNNQRSAQPSYGQQSYNNHNGEPSHSQHGTLTSDYIHDNHDRQPSYSQYSYNQY